MAQNCVRETSEQDLTSENLLGLIPWVKIPPSHRNSWCPPVHRWYERKSVLLDLDLLVDYLCNMKHCFVPIRQVSTVDGARDTVEGVVAVDLDSYSL